MSPESQRGSGACRRNRKVTHAAFVIIILYYNNYCILLASGLRVTTKSWVDPRDEANVSLYSFMGAGYAIDMTNVPP